jgi:hypothetical protein
MKFYIRRAVAAIIITPLVAGLYTLGYATLLLAGARPSTNISDTITVGFEIGAVLALALIFAPQVSRLIDKMEA